MNEPIEADEHGTNFDRLADRFSSNIYGTVKGQVRLAILREDLDEQRVALNSRGQLRVLDAGCGPALLSSEWASQGHEVTLIEMSQRMLARARQNFAEVGIASDQYHAYHGAVQQVLPTLEGRYDVVLLHAVLEWTPDPQALLKHVSRVVAPGGFLSVTFYNLDGFLYRRLLQGNFRHLDAPRPRPHLGDLTPIYPLRGHEVEAWLADAGMMVTHKRGLRCFVDYMHPKAAKVTDAQILEQERRFSRIEPYRSVSRYLHIVARPNPSEV